MNVRSIMVAIATVGPVGFLPAPGTMASLVTLMPVYGLWFVALNSALHALVIGLVTVVAYYSINYALAVFNQKDPAQIVIDEVVGCLLVFYGINLTWSYVLIGFGLFRVLDIYKPLGIARLQECSGAQGILLDDIAAGVMSNILLRLYSLL